MKSKRWGFLLALVVLFALAPVIAGAQEEKNPDESITYRGFTGLFNVVSPDTLDAGHISFGAIHRNFDRELTDLDANNLTVAFAVGIHDRLEFGFAYDAWRQVDYDLCPTISGLYNDFPNPVHTVEDGSGDLRLGAKVALARVEDGGAGLSVFGDVKIPIGDEDRGLGTGGTDVSIGAAIGYDPSPIALHANFLFAFNGDAKRAGEDDLDLANAFRWGVGTEFGARHAVRAVAELSGETFFSDDNIGMQEDALDLTLGIKIGGAQHKSGLTFGAAWQRNLLMDSERADGGEARPDGWVAELSYTTWDPPPPPPIPPPPVPVNNDPRVSLTITPKEVYPSWSPKVSKSTATAVASDPDGDTLSYKWSTSGGKLTGSGTSVGWTPPPDVEKGEYTITVQVADGRGGTATARDTVYVIPDPEHPKGIGKVFFEFDRYDLDAEDHAVLDRVARHMRENPTLKLTVEGHTCFIATEEYNLALGQHRAEAIRDYLVNAGVAASRLEVVSYGESRPWKDNSREITRRLNRRGEFVFAFRPMM